MPDSALVIGRAATPPKLDGVIEASEWGGAGFGSFDLNGDATKRTAIHALYDSDNLYFAFRCAEPSPHGISARYGPGKAGKFVPDEKGDCLSYIDDSIEIFISPDATQAVVFQFIANTIRGHLDIRYDLPKADQSYTSGFQSAARVGDDAWSIEFSVPLTAIDLEKITAGETTLRINFGRNHRVNGSQISAWRGFWAWRGPMGLAAFAPPDAVAIGDVSYGRNLLGRNTAGVSVRSATDGIKMRLRSSVTQKEKTVAQDGGWTTLEAGKTARLTTPYPIDTADSAYDFTLAIEGVTADGSFTFSEKQLDPLPPISAIIERNRYGPADSTASAFFNLHLDPASLKDFTFRAALTPADGPAVDVSPETLNGEIRFTLEGNEPADYTLNLGLLDARGRTVYATDVGKLSWTGAQSVESQSGSIPLKLDVFKSIANPAGSWPVTVGIPFPQGVLTSEAKVRLLSPAGEEVPIEVGVPATWDRGRTSIKWLHIRTMVDLLAGGKTYTLEYGPDVKRAAVQSKLKANQTADSIVVDTGRLRFVCNKKPFRFIDEAWLDLNTDGQYGDDEKVILRGPASGLRMETVDGRRYRSDGALDWPDVEKVELESIGPLEAVVRAEGWHTIAARDAKPERMMKYVVRIIATADTSLLRVFHSFILTEDEQTRYRQITLGFSMPDAETSVAATSSGADPMRETTLTAGGELSLTQVDHDAFRAHVRAPEYGKAIVGRMQGRKSEGWLLVERPGWGLTLATRDFWQNYAKGYEVTRDAVRMCPWPKDALDPLSFRPEDVIAPIFVKQLSSYTGGGAGGPNGENYMTYTYGVGTTPLGASKTHEYLLDFSTQPNLERGRVVQQLLNDPPLLIVPPEYACATEVLGKIHHADTETYAVEEAGFNAMLKRMEYGKPEYRHWGLVNFGESYQSCYDDGRLYFYRTYQNAGYGIVNDFPRGYLRSGNRDWLRYAVRRTRHNRDLDHSHYGPKAGGQTEYDALNWGTHHAIQTFWTHRQYLLLDWYMTGDRRSWDTYMLAARATLNINIGSGPKDDRHWFNIPKELIQTYEATWDPRYLEMAKEMVDGVLLAKEKAGEGKWPKNAPAYNEYLEPAFIVYHRFTRDPRVLEYLKAFMIHLEGKQGYSTGRAQDLAAYLYWETGEVQWLELVGGAEGLHGYMRLFETVAPPPVGGLRKMTVSEALGYMQNWGTKRKMVLHAHFADKGFHHAWERLWYFMAAVDDAKNKGILKPYEGPNNPWAERAWDADYWKTVSPEQAKEWGWE